MELKTNKFYSCPGFYLIVYPSLYTSMMAISNIMDGRYRTADCSEYYVLDQTKAISSILYSRVGEVLVRYTKPNELFYVIKTVCVQEATLGRTFAIFALFPEFWGWIIYEDRRASHFMEQGL